MSEKTRISLVDESIRLRMLEIHEEISRAAAEYLGVLGLCERMTPERFAAISGDFERATEALAKLLFKIEHINEHGDVVGLEYSVSSDDSADGEQEDEQ